MKSTKFIPFALAAIAIVALVSDSGFSAAKTPKSSTRSAPKIAWRPSFKAAQTEAKRSGKPILVDFTAQWCTNCKALDARTYTNANVIRLSQKFVAVKVDTDKDEATAKRYNASRLPLIAVLKPDGKMSSSVLGFRDAKGMTIFLHSALAKARRK